eukprot:s648_g5.t3
MVAAVRSNRFRIAMLMTRWRLQARPLAPGHLPKCVTFWQAATNGGTCPMAPWASRELPKWKRLTLGLLVLSKRENRLATVNASVDLPDMLPSETICTLCICRDCGARPSIGALPEAQQREESTSHGPTPLLGSWPAQTAVMPNFCADPRGTACVSQWHGSLNSRS